MAEILTSIHNDLVTINPANYEAERINDEGRVTENEAPPLNSDERKITTAHLCYQLLTNFLPDFTEKLMQKIELHQTYEKDHL